ncbi:MFS transporter [Nocardiopsis alba]|uniref:MFS transporter n=1 Tax=Nocardiopsis alba TaxID=53437 RepID=UPI00366E42DC
MTASPAYDKNGKTPALGKHFHRFWAGSLSSNLADGLMFTALPLLATTFTNDPLLVAGLAVARYLPWLLFGLVGGVLVDRWDRGRLMIAANLVRSVVLVVLAALVATGNAGIWALYVVMFTVMTCEIFYDLAGRAMLPNLAPARALDRANGRLVSGKTITEDFGGAPLAGLLFVVAAALPLAVNAGAYLLGALVLLGLPLAARRPSPSSKPGEAKSAGMRAVFADMAEGLRFSFGDRPLRSMIAFSVVTNMSFMAMNAVMVLLIQDHFGVPAALYGVFLTSSAVGALVGALLVGRLVSAAGRFRLQATGFVLMGVCCVSFGLAPNAYMAAAVWAVLGAVMTVSNTVMVGVLQLSVPNELLGRVMSAAQMLGFGLTPLGAVLGGLLGRVELWLPPVVTGAVNILALVAVLPALRALTTRANEAEEKAARATREAPDQGMEEARD